MIIKVLVRARLTIDGNMGSTKPLIVCAVHNILEVGAVVLVFTSIEHGMAFGIETWLMAIRTMCQIAVRTNKATT
jgi:hypothetical protein